MKKYLLFLCIAFSFAMYAQNGDEIFVEEIEGTEYVIHKYTSTGVSEFVPPTGVTQVDVLVVGGGGSGIENLSFSDAGGAGGGAGGLIYLENQDISSLSSPIEVIVGAGGLKRSSPNGTGVSNSGEDSQFANFIAIGGGGSSMNAANGSTEALPGGSGGGSRGSNTNAEGLQPTSASGGFGNQGGTSSASSGDAGGGGGGAGSAGEDGSGSNGGAGGDGLQFDIDGTLRFYAAGGGAGGAQNNTIGLGGSGIGGNGANDTTPATDGAPNTGSGGGGGNNTNVAGDGGSGIVIVRYRLEDITEFIFTNNGDWNDNTNWVNNTLPTLGADVIISANTQVTANETVGDIEVSNGVTVDINNNINLNIGGDISHLGEFTGDGEVVMNGTSIQSITGNGSFTNLRLTNENEVIVEDPMEVSNVLFVDQGTLTTNDKLVLRCDFVNGAAQVAPVSGSIVGNVETQQCYPAKRAWRFVSPSATTTTSIHANWQENATGFENDPNPGFGTHITGVSPGSANADEAQDGTNGFDYNPSGNPSIFTFDNVNQSWEVQPNTTSTLTAGTPYRLLIRGDRSIDITSNDALPEDTRLRETGALAVGTQNFSGFNAGNGAFNIFGNPYQAVVNMNEVFSNSTNIDAGAYYVWDPQINSRGGYVTISLPNGDNSVSSDANAYLQPKQAAFFIADGNGAPTLTFNESYKAVEQDQTEVFSQENEVYLNMKLHSQESFTNGDKAFDGLRIHFNEAYTNSSEDDYPKLGNQDENLARANDNYFAALEYREMPLENEVLPLFINQYRNETYVFELDIVGELGRELFIYDAYLDEQVEVTETNFVYEFEIDASIPESVAQDRFELNFGSETFSSEEFENNNISLYPNPSSNGYFKLSGSALEGETKLSIFDQLGRKVYETEVNASGAIEVNDFKASSGLYLIQLNNKNVGNQTIKLMVK